MAPILPLEVCQIVSRQHLCRETQIQQLSALYNGTHPAPHTLIAYGLEETNKLDVITAILEAQSLKHVIIKCRDCLSQRHLLAKIFSGCLSALHVEGDAEHYDRVDSINSLVVDLEKLFRKREDRLILVLEGIDRQRGVGGTLLPALARLGDMIPNISVILASGSPQQLPLHKSGVPYIYFPPYSRAEAIHLVTTSDPPVPQGSSQTEAEDLKRIYLQFAVTVYDSLISATSSTSITTFRNICERLWPRFIWPAVSGEKLTGRSQTTATWDFARLLVRNRSLFQTEGESLLINRLQPRTGAWTFEDLHEAASQQAINAKESSSRAITPSEDTKSHPPTTTVSTTTTPPPLLKHFPTTLLLSSYLASHTPAKNDIVLFSRLSSSTKRIRKNRVPRKSIFKSPGTPKSTTKSSSKPFVDADGTPRGNPTTNTTTSNKAAAAGGGGGLTKNMLGRTRTLFDQKFGAPKPFSLERLLAVLRAVHPDGFKRTRGVADRVYREMGELERMRLVDRVGGGSGGGGGGDEDAGGGRWKVAVGRDVVEHMLRDWGIEGGIAEWEGQDPAD